MISKYIAPGNMAPAGRCEGCRIILLPSPPASGKRVYCAKQRCCGRGAQCVLYPRRPCPPTPCPPSQTYFALAFDATGGVPTPLPQAVAEGGLATRPADPARIGYVFDGWYQATGFSDNAWDFAADAVTRDMVLYARWSTEYFNVAFDANGGAPTPPVQTVVYGGLVTRPADPVRPDYVFVAWYPTPDLTGTPWIFNGDVVTGNVTLYARWLQPVG